jgi:hypothetical protein
VRRSGTYRVYFESACISRETSENTHPPSALAHIFTPKRPPSSLARFSADHRESYLPLDMLPPLVKPPSSCRLIVGSAAGRVVDAVDASLCRRGSRSERPVDPAVLLLTPPVCRALLGIGTSGEGDELEVCDEGSAAVACFQGRLKVARALGDSCIHTPSLSEMRTFSVRPSACCPPGMSSKPAEESH